MKYIPNTKKQQTEMLETIGAESISDLFSSIPKDLRFKGNLNIPNAKSEMELIDYMKNIEKMNTSVNDKVCFLGAGAYDHYIPVVINHMISREEFYTAYTPYQPEISQGVLQAIFEYQTMICELTGMEAANASMYDGSSALAEACSVAVASSRKKNKIILANGINPEAITVVKTYLKYRDIEIITVDIEKIEDAMDDTVAGVCVQTPNFFGNIENLEKVSKLTQEYKSLFIVSVDPISLGILEAPGKLGADIVVGEGQSLGNALAFGGPHLGFFAAKGKYVRKMPGRIVGQTTDTDGKRAFVLTLQAREQHIRREKATSNICSNQALNALVATIYLSVVGKEGLKEIALRCLNNANYMKNELLKTGLFEEVNNKPIFKEFVLKYKKDISKLNKHLLENGIIGGYDLGENLYMIATTEKRTKKQIDDFVKKAGEVK